MAFVFLDPRQGPKAGDMEPAGRLTSLKGKKLGILWNNRPRGDRLLKLVAELLQQKCELAEVYFTKKPFIGNEAPQELIDDLASRVDAAILGVGDWGSCTSGSVLDAVNLERQGIPTAVVGLDKLVNTTGKGMAQAQGYPSMRFAVIPYAVTDWGGAATDDALIAKAKEAAPQVEHILTV